ncbi:MAG: tetratricopeptide repeat protein [Planctomycetes bacterium]|nr:tetratricopeptide repeat protein [Planctomycetota bacterium]
MKCPGCGADNPDGVKFCGECGVKLANICPSCGAQNPPNVKFCGECGTPLAKKPAVPPAQPPAQAPQAPAPPAYPPQQYPGQQQQGYPPQQQQGYPPQQYPGQQQQGYPPQQYPGQQQQGYPPQQYPGQQQQGYPPQQYPGQQQQGYPSQQYPGQQQQGFPPQQYPGQQGPLQQSPQGPSQTGGTRVGDTGYFPKETQVLTRRDELKNVTIIFADVKGFTSLSEKLLPDEVKDVMDECFAGMEKEIKGNGGVVDKYIGDCVMALFGAPVAHENDPQRAVKAAIGMQASLQRFAKKLMSERGFSINMRVGINTGKVLAGNVGKDFSDFTVMGDAVNLASRLEHMAPVGGILISHNTYKHVRKHFLFKKVGPVEVRGLQRQVDVYEVLGEKELAPILFTFDVAGVKPSMIGREREITTLKSIFKEVMEEKYPKIVMMTGAHGVGKSRLIYEFAKYMEGLPDAVYYRVGKGAENSPSSYWIISEILKSHLDISPEDGIEGMEEKIYTTILGYTPNKTEALEITHFVGNLMGLPLNDSPILKPYKDNPKLLQQLMFKSLVTLFTLSSRKTPLIIVAEDIHWADPGTLDALTYVAMAIENAPVMILTTAREDQFPAKDTFCKNLPNFITITLAPLSEKYSARLVNEILVRVKEIPERLISQVIKKAEGNPYYIEEIIKDLIERNIISTINETLPDGTSKEKWFIKEEALTELVVPETLEGLIQTRIDRLPDIDKVLLQEASIVGRDFWESVLMSLEKKLYEDNPGLVLPPMHQRIVGIEQKEFVYQKPISSFTDDTEYTFKHTFTRDVIYSTIPGKVKKNFHGVVAAWLKDRTKDSSEKYASLLAFHYENAAQPDIAKDFYLKAAEAAKEVHDNIKAIAMYKKVLELNKDGDKDFFRKTKKPIAELYAIIGRFDDALIYLNELLDIETDMAERADLLADIGKVYERKGEYQLSLKNYTQGKEQILSLPKKTVGIVMGKILNGMAGSYLRRGENDFSLASATESFNMLKEQFGDDQNPKVMRVLAETLNIIGVVLQQKGDFTPAMDNFKKAMTLNEKISNAHGVSVNMNNIGIIHLMQGELDEAKVYYERSLDLAEKVGDMIQKANALSNVGIVLQRKYYYEKALITYNESLKIRERIGDKTGMTSSIVNISMMDLMLGNTEKVQDLPNRAAQIGIDTQDKVWQWFQNGLLGGAALINNDTKQALEKFDITLKLAEEMKSIYYQAISLLQFVETYLQAKEYQKSIETAMKVKELFGKMNDKDNVIQVNILLVENYVHINDLVSAKAIIDEIAELIKASNDKDMQFKYNYALAKYYSALAASSQPPDNCKQMAKDHYQQAIEIKEFIAKNIESETIRTKYLSKHDITEVRRKLQEIGS